MSMNISSPISRNKGSCDDAAAAVAAVNHDLEGSAELEVTQDEFPVLRKYRAYGYATPSCRRRQTRAVP